MRNLIHDFIAIDAQLQLDGEINGGRIYKYPICHSTQIFEFSSLAAK